MTQDRSRQAGTATDQDVISWREGFRRIEEVTKEELDPFPGETVRPEEDRWLMRLRIQGVGYRWYPPNRYLYLLRIQPRG